MVDSEGRTLQFKVVLVGDSNSGKTALVKRLCNDEFSKHSKPTVGLDFYVKRLTLPGDVSVSLEVWDVGGTAIGSKMITNYIFGAQAVCLVYDVTNFHSFQNLETWLAAVKRAFAGSQLPLITLIGTKVDQIHLRTVKGEKHKEFATEHELTGFTVSSRSGDQVEASFVRIAADLAGITISKPDLEVAAKIVKVEVEGDPTVKTSNSIAQKERKHNYSVSCSVM
eukprot:Opistho-2@82760